MNTDQMIKILHNNVEMFKQLGSTDKVNQYQNALDLCNRYMAGEFGFNCLPYWVRELAFDPVYTRGT